MKEQIRNIFNKLEKLSQRSYVIYNHGLCLINFENDYYEIFSHLWKLILTKEGIEDLEYYIYTFLPLINKGESCKWVYLCEKQEKNILTFDNFYDYLVYTNKFLYINNNYENTNYTP